MSKIIRHDVSMETLTHVLSAALTAKVTHADYEIKQLHGGDVGNVQLVTGMAKTTDGEKLPFNIVLKIQKKWERYGDPDSWRREYDLYSSGLSEAFSDSFRWPNCYHTELNNDETKIWIEYIDGISSLNLTVEMYERAAEELGRFQGKLYAEQPTVLQSLTNLSKVDFIKNFYLRYKSWSEVYDYIRNHDCEIPRHLCKMLIDIDNNADKLFKLIEKLPIVLCHRDFWVANIFYSNDKILLIDWDTTGWGYMGEDIASLIADEADVSHMVEYYHKCVPAYYKGFSEYVDISHISNNCIYELILFMFGYRLVEWYKYAESLDEKILHLNTLQKIYEMKEN
jgi:fructosamine-3-kinase